MSLDGKTTFGIVYVGRTQKECADWLATSLYSLENWLTDCALEEGSMVTCPHCGEQYWYEDACQNCWEEVEKQ